jgi:PhzF family phenazine biosynthesis protein
VTSAAEPLIVSTTVFALAPGGGNPCPVVLDADALSDDQMQAIAASRRLETGFVVRPARPDADVRLRYFVPNHEMEMCVHATIAAVTVLRARSLIVEDAVAVETAIGLVTVTVGGSEDPGSPTVTVEQRRPEVTPFDVDAGEVARALGLDPGSIDPSLPIEAVSTARSKLMVPLRDHRALDGIDLRPEELWALCDRAGTTGVYAFTTAPRHRAAVAEARQFPVRAGYPEDPATGVAACALGAYLSAHTASGDRSDHRTFQIEQGHAMGRPSVLVARTLVEDGIVARTWIEGSATIEP